MALSTNDKKVRAARKVIREGRKKGEVDRALAPSRSTGIRRQYAASHTALGKVEAILDAK